jgi:hypothetical protein
VPLLTVQGYCPALIAFNRLGRDLRAYLYQMNDSLKDWIGAIIIVPIILAVYLYLDNPNFASFINKTIDKPPYVSVRQDSLIIEDFKWNIGIEGRNIVGGDFDRLNKKVYNILKDKSGVYHVVLKQNKEDKFGNSYIDSYSVGILDAEGLNKYQTEEYWIKEGGISRMISSRDSLSFNKDGHLVEAIKVDEVIYPVYKKPAVKADQQLLDYKVEDAQVAEWIYYERQEGQFKVISPESAKYGQLVEYWKDFKQNIKSIHFIVLVNKVDVTLAWDDGTIGKFELLPILGNSLFGVYKENYSITVQILPDNSSSIGFTTGDRYLATFIDK